MSTVLIARLVLETQSPMAITSGFRELGFDNELARDANGLPYIPATSFVGVWRNVIRHTGKTDSWFGTTEKKSALVVSHGVVHNSSNSPVTGLHTPDELRQDKLLERLLTPDPIKRDRVALNDRGVAADTAKFDQVILPAGVRFSLTVKLDSRVVGKDAENLQESLMQLLSLIDDRRFALGSTTRNGLGRVRVQACEVGVFDLRGGPSAAQQMHEFLRNNGVPTANALTASSSKSLTLFAETKLQALGAWRAGSGSQLLSKSSAAYDPDMKTYSEPFVEWSAAGKASLRPPRPMLCGSSIKGILAHRIAFHWRRLNQQWAETLADAEDKVWETRPQALTDLLGSVRGEEDSSSLFAGRLWVDDSEIDYEHTQVRFHNAVDRFTGGVRKSALFSEEVLYQPKFTVRIWLDDLPESEHKELLLKALEATIDDMKNGFLPMGAASGRGNSLVREVH